MNRNDFNRFISGGALPGPGDLEGIRELTDLFPWFHAAHLVLLRGLKENADVRFESQLRSSALSVSDREVLYHYLFMQPAEPEIKAVTEAVTEVMEEPDAETSQLQETGAEAEAVVIHEAEAEVESVVIHETESEAESVVVHEAETQVEPEPEPEPEPGVISSAAAVTTVVTTREELIAEIEARLAEMASASATVLELDHASQSEPESVPEPEPESEQPEESVAHPHEEEELLEFIGDEEPVAPEPEQKLTPADLIDRFIMTSPRIERMTPAAEQPVKDLAEPSAEEQGTFITETLARIYVNQGYYFKAINIYEKLSLKYPEKSAYFASRIEKIKELIK